MTDEYKAELAADEAQVDTEAQDASSNPAGKQDEGSNSDNTIDYEAERQLLLERVEKAEKAAADNAFKLRDKKRKQQEEEEEEIAPEDKPVTASELRGILESHSQNLEKKLTEGRAQGIADSMTSSAAESAYMMDIYRNRTFPAHLSLEERMEEAYLIANRKKIIGENSELKRALNNKGGVINKSASSQGEALPGNEPELAPDVKLVLQQSGYTFNSSTRNYEKKLRGGKMLVYDFKTKKPTLVEAK